MRQFHHFILPKKSLKVFTFEVEVLQNRLILGNVISLVIIGQR